MLDAVEPGWSPRRAMSKTEMGVVRGELGALRLASSDAKVTLMCPFLSRGFVLIVKVSLVVVVVVVVAVVIVVVVVVVVAVVIF